MGLCNHTAQRRLKDDSLPSVMSEFEALAALERKNRYRRKWGIYTGTQGLIRFIRETIANPWLDYKWQSERLAAPFQLRLV